MSAVPGAVVLVATPLGNLGDLAPRAVAALAEADVVACEDTRRTGRLLELSGVGHRPMVVVNDHTEAEQAPRLIRRAADGERVVVVSDAGMPGISDPGERLVRAAIDAGVAVEVVPGPSAVVTALVVSGLPAARFSFEGFLPRRGAERSTRIAEVAAERRTVVLYEAPHRLARTLADLRDACGEGRSVAVCRELTKMHEEVWRGSLGEAAARAEAAVPRGEHVVVLAGAEAPEPASDPELLEALDAARGAGASTRDAVDAVSARFGVARNRVYQLATGR